MDDTVAERIASAYRIEITGIKRLHFGNDAQCMTWRVDDGAVSYFLKSRNGEFNQAVLKIPAYLRHQGVAHIIEPLMTRNGALSHRIDGRAYVLYPYLDGAGGGPAPMQTVNWIDLGQTLRTIHDMPLPTKLRRLLRVEDYRPAWAGVVRSIDRCRTKNIDRIDNQFLTLYDQQRNRIDQILRKAEIYGRNIRERELPRCVCHGDIHLHNILPDPAQGFVIIDWDELILACKERDLMFYEERESHDSEPFYRGYGAVTVDREAIAYYRCEWVIQEVGDYAKRTLTPLFNSEISGESRSDMIVRQEGFNQFVKLFNPGDVVDAAVQSINSFESG